MARRAWMSPNLRWLIAARGVRSFSQAFVTIGVPLFLVAAHYTAIQVGFMLSISAAGAALLLLGVGVYSDRYGRRRTMIALALLAALGCLIYATTTAFWLLAAGAAVATVGRGGSAAAGGTIGPFYPAEQPLVAGSVNDENRNSAFTALTFVGVLAGAAGSVTAGLPNWLHHALALNGIAAYRPLFWLGVAACLVLALVVLPIAEPPRPAPQAQRITPGTVRLLGRLSITSGLNGVARGLIGPFLTYWFAIRFGTGPGAMGAVFALASLSSAVPLLLSGWLARTMGGSVRAITVCRLTAGVLIASMAAAPSFALASLCLILRQVVVTLAVPLRQSYVMGVADEGNRSVVAAFGNLPSQVTSIVSPSVGAYLLDAVAVATPMWIAACSQAADGIAYFLAFRNIRPPEERAVRPPRAPGDAG